MKAELGKRYRDKVSGFEGVAVGITHWMTGCSTIGLQPGFVKDGVLSSLTWLDEVRLVEVNEPEAKEVQTDRTKGGPHDDPVQYSDK